MQGKTLIIIRHAKPEENFEKGDFKRALSTEGRLVHQKMCALLKSKGYEAQIILSSPLLRAKQTAEITASNFNAPVEEREALSYHFDIESLLKHLRKCSEGTTVFWIGHEPNLSKGAEHLVGKDFLHTGLAKSGMIAIHFASDIDFGKGTLLEYLHPGLL